MGKKCIICDEEAIFKIKDTSDYYCQDCAEENFADTTILLKVVEEAQRLKEYVEQKINDNHEEESEQEQNQEDNSKR